MYFLFPSVVLITVLNFNVECMQKGEFISVKEAPYFASIIKPDKGRTCGAAIISEYWLISAAHCVRQSYKEKKVRTGASSNYSNGSIHTIDHVVIPDNYSNHISTFTNIVVGVNDIGLIKLKEPIKFDEYQQPIKLRSRSPKENETVTIIGLGNERISSKSPSLKKSVLSVAAKAPPRVPDPSTVFHLQNSTSHVCPGDSGSPGVIDNELAGIIVYGDEKCIDWFFSLRNKYPGALTRIDLFYNWILDHTKIKN